MCQRKLKSLVQALLSFHLVLIAAFSIPIPATALSSGSAGHKAFADDDAGRPVPTEQTENAVTEGPPFTSEGFAALQLTIHHLDDRLDTYIEAARSYQATARDLYEQTRHETGLAFATIGGLAALLAIASGSLLFVRERRERVREEKFDQQRLESLSETSQVVRLIRETFDMQKEREKEFKKIQKSTEALNQAVFGKAREDFLAVQKTIFEFEDLSRMNWTRLTPVQQREITDALSTFKDIHEDTCSEELKRDPVSAAKMLQLLGVGAYYSNDLDGALTYLRRSADICNGNPAAKDQKFVYPFCNYYLGLIEKHWRPAGISENEGLRRAISHMEVAHAILRHKSTEFLTPIALGEMLSYQSDNTSSTRGKQTLEEVIERLDNLKKDPIWEKDPVYEELLGRACLMRGNIEFLSGERNYEEARKWYQRSVKESPSKHYAYLSLGLVTPRGNEEERNDCFQRGLGHLRRPGALERSEDITRAIGLAWGWYAAHQIGEKEVADDFKKSLHRFAEGVRPIRGRVPVFFCPLTKQLTSIEAIQENIKNAIEVDC